MQGGSIVHLAAVLAGPLEVSWNNDSRLYLNFRVLIFRMLAKSAKIWNFNTPLLHTAVFWRSVLAYVCIKLARFSGFQPPNVKQEPLQSSFLLKSSLYMAILLFAPFRCTHPPTHIFSAHTEPISRGIINTPPYTCQLCCTNYPVCFCKLLDAGNFCCFNRNAVSFALFWDWVERGPPRWPDSQYVDGWLMHRQAKFQTLFVYALSTSSLIQICLI